MAIQTPKQRLANEKYMKRETAKRGQADEEIQKSLATKTKSLNKPSLSQFWVGVLAFILLGGAVFELIRFIF